MKAFFSQTWVVAAMVAIVAVLVCWVIFKNKEKEDAPADDPNPDETPAGQE